MADDSTLDQLKAYFFANDPNLTANLKLRERIALAQMARRSAYPKTLGEGLSSIGDSISDAWMMRNLEKADAAGMKEAASYGGPPAAGAPAAAPPPVRRSYAPEDANTVAPVEREPPRVVTPALLPAVPLPPDQQQSDEPGAPIRMPSPAAVQDWRNANPLPPSIPPQPTARAVAPSPPQLPPSGRIGDQPAGGPVNRLMTPPGPLPPGNIPAPTLNDRLAPAFPGQQSAAPPPPGTPVMAAGNEASAEEMAAARDRLAQAMMQQQAARGGPQPLPTTRAATPPPPAGGNAGISAAPPVAPAPIQAMPEQPGAVAGWVPAPASTQPRAAPIIRPSDREIELARAVGMAVQRNPYMAQSPAAIELGQLQRDREARQKDADKLFEAQIARDTKQQELHLTGRMDQPKRIEDVRKSRLEQRQIEQGLIDGGGDQQATDPRLLGTPQSPQRSGRPEVDQVPKGAIPEVWAKDQQAKIAKTAETLDSAKPELAEALSLLNKARTHPAKEASLGTLGGLARLTAPGQGFAAIMEQLGGKNFLAGYQKLKGTGQISEIEGLKTEQAQARLKTAQTKEDFDDALKDLEGSMRGAVERVERKMRQPVTAYQKTPDDPYAPDINQRGTRNGKLVEYIGGDPSQDSSYRTVRR
jgi:hypothetical protein